jgi:hypothetical protein
MKTLSAEIARLRRVEIDTSNSSHRKDCGSSERFASPNIQQFNAPSAQILCSAGLTQAELSLLLTGDIGVELVRIEQTAIEETIRPEHQTRA